MAKATAIGLDISTSSIKFAEVNLGKKEPVLTNIGMVPLPEGLIRDGEVENLEGVSAALKELWKQFRIKRKRVILGIANQKVIVRPMDLPYLPAEELDSAVRYQVQEFIPIPIEEAVIDYEVVDEYITPEEERMQTVLLAAAHKEMVNIFVDVLQAAGLVPEAVEVKAFAIVRSLLKKEYQFLEEEQEPTGSVCLVNVGAGITNLCLVKEGTPRFVRMIMRGGDYFTKILMEQLSMSPAEAEDIKRGRSQDEEATKLLQKEMQTFIGEIRRSLEYYISQTQERDLNKVILSGSGSKVVNLAVEINRGLRLPAEMGHPLQNVQLGKLPYTPEEIAELEPSVAVCVGLALRDTEE